ncbi:RNA-directed DNA polymerase -like protein, partial [Trichinella sp. T8]
MALVLTLRVSSQFHLILRMISRICLCQTLFAFLLTSHLLNAVTRVDAQPIPRIDDTLDALAGAKWFSTLDLASGYWQVEVAEEDRE